MIFVQAPAFIGCKYGKHQTDCAGNQRRKFFVYHCQCDIGKGTGENGNRNKADIFTDFLPRYDEAQADNGNDEACEEMHDTGLHTDFHNIRMGEFQRREAEPGRRTNRTEGYGDGVHHQCENGDFQGVEAQTHQNRRGNRSRRTEAGCPFNHKGKRPADNHQLGYGIGTDGRQPFADDIDTARGFHHTVEHNCAEDNGNRRECRHQA